ncbi:AAA family ATPase [Kurthia senegalensis]|uniref:AAA family ATPase n=1 Tax=Kurthia senegalensis TaxID=1033740 RepID=UPI000287B07B|nr:SMC family ATPase [Kurthia senegalensis]
MQPKLLKMTAFGPYKNCETIDFRLLGEQRLFVISGATGAGKTTIFDALLYALYGTASGEDRQEARNLRSQFAEEDVATTVELQFEIQQKLYRIFRQLPYKKAGNKSETPGKVELYEIIDGQEIPLVDQQKATDIAEKIQQLLGLTKEQFKQIVMLPQGEFQKLLTSDTENKEEILRKLFKTMKYGKIVEGLKEKRNDAQKQLDEAQLMEQQLYHTIQQNIVLREESELASVFQQNDFTNAQLKNAMAVERQFVEETIPNLEKRVRELSTHYDEKMQALGQAESLNEQIDQLQALKRQAKQLAREKEAMEHLKHTVQLITYAEKITPYDEQYKKEKQQLTKLQTLIQTLETEKEQAVTRLNEQQQRYEQAMTAKEQIPHLERELRALVPLLPLFEQLQQLQSEQVVLQTEQQQMEEKLIKERHVLEEARRVRNEKQQAIRQIEEEVASLPSLQENLYKEMQNVQQMERWMTANQTFNSMRQEVLQSDELYKEASAHYEQLRASWLSNQAFVLAQELVEGEPCPVCGSSHHDLSQKEVVSFDEQEFERAKMQLDTRQNAFYRVKASYESSETTVRQVEQQCIQLGIDLSEPYDVTQVKQLEQRVGHLKTKQQQLVVDRRTLDEMASHIEVNEQRCKQVEQHVYELQQRVAANRARLDDLLQKLPENYTSKDQLTKEIQRLEMEQKAIEQTVERATDALQQAKNQFVICETNVINRRTQATETEERLQVALQSFQERVLQQFRDGAHYQEIKRQIPQYETFKTTYESYEQQSYSVKNQLTALAVYEGKERVDVTVLQTEAAHVKEKVVAANDSLAHSVQQVKDFKHFEQQVTEMVEKIQQLTAKATEIVHVYDLLRGQNRQKMSFERYLQIEYLEQIIEAANIRLRKLSNGQFELRRSDRLEARGKQSGLGLDVYDAYTGLERDVKTMSGGEKFNASLCLALGISDIIQSSQGQMQMDMMFIDEGFGTLDDEALNKAIDTLVDLQKSGRMIGVISHVRGLKEAIPAVLEVKKQSEGYSHATFHIQ